MVETLSTFAFFTIPMNTKQLTMEMFSMEDERTEVSNFDLVSLAGGKAKELHAISLDDFDPSRCTTARGVKNRYKKPQLVQTVRKHAPKFGKNASKQSVADLCDILSLASGSGEATQADSSLDESKARTKAELLVDKILDRFDGRRCTDERSVRDRYRKPDLATAAATLGLPDTESMSVVELCDAIAIAKQQVESLPGSVTSGSAVDEAPAPAPAPAAADPGASKPGDDPEVSDSMLSQMEDMVAESLQSMRGVGYSHQCLTPCRLKDPSKGKHAAWCETDPYQWYIWTYDWDYCVPPVVLKKGRGISDNPKKPCLDECAYRPHTTGSYWTLGNVVGAAGAVALGAATAAYLGPKAHELVSAATSAIASKDVLEFIGTWGGVGVWAINTALTTTMVGAGSKLASMVGGIPGAALKAIGETGMTCKVEEPPSEGKEPVYAACMTAEQTTDIFIQYAEYEMEQMLDFTKSDKLKELTDDIVHGMQFAKPEAKKLMLDSVHWVKEMMDLINATADKIRLGTFHDARAMQTISRAFTRLAAEMSTMVHSAKRFYGDMAGYPASAVPLMQARQRFVSLIKPQTEKLQVPETEIEPDAEFLSKEWFGQMYARFTVLWQAIKRFQANSNFRWAMFVASIYAAAATAVVEHSRYELLPSVSLVEAVIGKKLPEGATIDPFGLGQNPIARAMGLDKVGELLAATVSSGGLSLGYVLSSLCLQLTYGADKQNQTGFLKSVMPNIFR